MQPVETCEVCGLAVGAKEAVRAELAVGDMICPTAMVFHPSCHEKALEIWAPDPDSLCTVDTEFPETQTWTPHGAPDTGITHSGGRS